MTYEKPELVHVAAAAAVVLGDPDGLGDNFGTLPDQRIASGLSVGLDD